MGRKAYLPAMLHDYDFEQLARRESHARTRIRFLGLAHLLEGKTCAEVAAMLKVHVTSVRGWVRRCVRWGLEGLREHPGRGAKRKLGREREEALKQAVEELQAARRGGRVRGRDIQQLLAEQFGVDCALSTVYDTLHRAGLVWVTSRSKSPRHDPEAQAAFKKLHRRGEAGVAARP